METIKKVPTTLGGSFSHGWQVMSNYFLILFLVVFVMGLLYIPAQFTGFGFNGDSIPWQHFGDFGDLGDFEFLSSTLLTIGVFAIFLGIISLAYSLLVVPVFEFGSRLIFVHAARDIRPEFETLVMGFRKNYLHIVLANLLSFALVGMGFVFLIIPGIIIACRLKFVAYLVMDKGLDPINAIEEGWKITKGHGWTIFGMALLSFFIFIFGLMLCFVGVVPAQIWIKSSFASLYVGIQNERTPIEEEGTTEAVSAE